LLGGAGDPELVGVGGTLLGFDEDAEFHAASVEAREAAVDCNRRR
jgi:hypothetical protein